MIVLHAGIRDGQLVLWGEAAAELPTNRGSLGRVRVGLVCAGKCETELEM